MKPTRFPRHASAPVPAHAALAAVAALLLGACSLLGAGGERERGTIFAPAPAIQADPAWPAADWQLSVNPPTAPRTVDTFRVVVRPTPGELQVYKGAIWSQPAPDLVQDAVVHAFEDSGRIGGVTRNGAGINSDFQLLLDVRRFDSDYAEAGGPADPGETKKTPAREARRG